MSTTRPRPSYNTTSDESSSQYVSAQSYLHDTTQESMWTAPSPPNHSNLPYFDEPRALHPRHSNIDKSLRRQYDDDEVDSSIEYLSRPNLTTNRSYESTTSSTSSGSEVDMSGSLQYPFFVNGPLPPRTPRPFNQTSSTTKENVRFSQHIDAPSPRPTSPLPPLPPSIPTSTTIQHLRGPSNTTSNSDRPYRAPPLTCHNSLASFQSSHHLLRSSTSKTVTMPFETEQQETVVKMTTGSEDSHRTSSEVDLDISFDYDPRQDRPSFSDESRSSREGGGGSSSGHGGSTSMETDRSGAVSGEGSLEKLEQEVMKGGWVGIDMLSPSKKTKNRPLDHGIPEGQLVRSESGKLVGAQSSKARSALDLRAQFKADEIEGRHDQDVSIVMMQDVGSGVEDTEEEMKRRREIRAGKQPIEGLRAIKSYGDDANHVKVDRNAKRRSVGRGFTYNPTESLVRPAPHSAPLLSEPVFASQQDRLPDHQVVDLSPFSAELDQAKRTKAFPLPLRLIDRTKRTNHPGPTSPKIASFFVGGRSKRQSLTYYDSDAGSIEPSPLFDRHTDDEGGTVQTAPSTPNDTPLFRECFDEDETTPPPLPDKEEALAGLGFDFDLDRRNPQHVVSSSEVEEFPVVPLRRRSLPPPVPYTANPTRRMSNRHMPIPSLSISPPPRSDNGAHDQAVLEDIPETDSSRSSQDSAQDPTVSPSRRLSRRLSGSVPLPSTTARPTTTTTRRQSFVAHSPPSPSNSPNRLSSTPKDHGRGATIITPQHLLSTPSDRTTSKPSLSSSPSFSFSPAPLRLVKAQLLRAAGYSVVPPSTATPTVSLAPGHASPSSPRKQATPQSRRNELSPSPLSSSPTMMTPNDKNVSTGRGELKESSSSSSAKRRNVGSTWEELSDLLSSSAETWIDEVVPAKLAFIAGFLLGPWCWIIGGWFLRSNDGELVTSRGQRCRDETCNCGRILRGSVARQQSQHQRRRIEEERHSTTSRVGGGGEKRSREREDDDFAGLDKWVFVNRVAACGGGIGIATIVAVAIWAAASA